VNGGPLVIAHAAADAPGGMARAARDADLVEADVRRFRGRLEVRHAKTLGPLPVLWDHGRLHPPGTPRPLLAEVLRRVPEGAGLVLDLKGPDPRIVPEVLAATAGWRAARPLVVSARAWRTADRLRGFPGITVVHSVGGPRGLRALLRRYPPGALEGVAAQRSLLTPGVVGALRERAAWVWAWPVDDPETAAALAAWGVTGLISNAPGRLRAMRGAARER
jgi:glycerophosphoryl diester phosphodiesterase